MSIEYTFKGESAHSAAQPWRGRSALDAVELMDIAWNFRREHLRLQQRSHNIITNGGDQPNVVPQNASVWYYFRETDYEHIKELREIGDTIAKAAAMMTNTEVSSRLLGSAWPQHMNKTLAEGPTKRVQPRLRRRHELRRRDEAVEMPPDDLLDDDVRVFLLDQVRVEIVLPHVDGAAEVLG